MDHRKLALLLTLALSTACSLPPVKTGGYVAADGRVFVQPPKYAGQEQGTGVSLVVEPELAVQSENEVHTVTARPFYRLDPYDAQRSHADIRQASYQMASEGWELGLGAGIFTWGVLESYRPVDVMNQIDFVDAIDGSAKLGQPYLEIGHTDESASLRLYYLPYFRERTFPGVDGRLRFASVVNTRDPIFESKLGAWHPSGAARLTFSPGHFDIGLGVFSGYSREPRFVAELTTGRVAPRYDVIQQASADVQWTSGPWAVKAEGFFRLWTLGLRPFGGGGAGLEYTFSDLAGGADLTAVAELFFDTRPIDAPITLFQHDGALGLRLGFNDTSSTEILAGAIVDVVDHATFARLEAGRRFGDHWRATVGGFLFLARDGTIEGSFAHDSYAAARLGYYF